jgi:hypothetical protein
LEDERLKGFYRNESFLGLALSAIAFAVYCATLAPSIGFIDAGELATVAATFGIAHPSGYPLFTLVAGAFARLPIGDTVLCCAASVYFGFRFLLALLRSGLPSSASKSPQARGSADASAGVENASRAAAAIGALTLAFSRSVWEQSTGVEVYSLHLLLVCAALFFFVRALQGSRRSWYLFAFALGLAFSNHLTTVLLLPGLAWWFFVTHGSGRMREAWLKILRGLPVFILGLTPYLWLPLRAAAHPVLNWGNPVNWENFLRHVTGKQYSVWMFASFDAALEQLRVFSFDFPLVFGWVAVLPMALGLADQARVAWRQCVFTVLIFAGCVFYSINYTVPDISNYYLVADLAGAVWVAWGVAWLLRRSKTFQWPAAGALAAACILTPLLLHYRTVDESRNYVVEDYARNLFRSLEPKATVLTFQWDNFVAAAWYLQIVEGYRTDVVVLERELLRRSWYVDQLRHNHPEAVAGSHAEIEGFLRAVQPFERGEPFDGTVIQAAFEAMIASLMRHALTRGPVYFTPEVERVYVSGYRAVPSGLALRAIPEGEPIPILPTPDFAMRPIPKPGRLIESTRAMYAAAYVNHAYQQGATGNLPAVEPLLLKALAIRPGYPQAIDLLRRLHAAR